MSRKVKYTRRAEMDMEEIYLYTRNKWGRRQAELYTDKLLRKIAHTSELPNDVQTRDRSNLLSGCRSTQSQKHHVFYLVKDTFIEVIRILHENMNTERELAKNGD